MFGLGGIVPMLLLVVTLGGSVVWYYNDTQDRLAHLRESNAALESANKTNQETIRQMEVAAEFQTKLNTELLEKFNEAESKVDALRDKLIDHNLTELSLKKPGLIEKRINNGTQKVFDDLERLTTVERVQLADTGTSGGDGNEDSKTND